MIKQFKPTWMIPAIYNVTPAQLRARGIKAVFADLDNTLIAWDNPDGTPELKKWMHALQDAGIPLVVVSNNSEPRIAKALATLELPFVSRALKPLPLGIAKARHNLNLRRDEVVMVGDQYITDMWAAHLAGVNSILVKPLVTTDAWNTRINRFFERFIKLRLAHVYPDMHFQEELK
ncbi:YqeG family HAD IIIA-type phosphatase [Lactiplantibacillus garii]|uniref:YqeG family HAD IIIA-type phosphatase n=1 Tax=Lactiplantibacillus garii TaxID=2306423 RepID=A0A3R8L053_9LACO|nr:YqeG family HAD IIIA-type phosphatase [Lactiplantibacillus garii]RRK09873.1 YqeG family HAD IIIA-type phosphatase [Lactiplantibacillus garii]